MRGKYYLKHTINHSVDNQTRNKNLDNAYKNSLKNDAIQYIRKSDVSIEEKVKYLKNLTHDIFRYGTKYKYNCSLSTVDISQIIKSCGDKRKYEMPKKFLITCKEFEIKLEDEFISELEHVYL